MTRRQLSPRVADRSGFTLVELLVVIAIIGTLVALLLPAVQAARETARGNTCRNNIKQLVTAMTNYDSTQGELPGFVNEIAHKGSVETNGEFAVGRRASWLVMSLPYMENGPLWDRWTQEFASNTPATGASNFIPVPNEVFAGLPATGTFVCPSDPPETEGTPENSYVANAGQAFGDSARLSPPGGTLPQSAENTEYAANGVFFDLNKKSSSFTAGWPNAADGRESQPKLQSSINYVQSGDGTSKTMMVSENVYAFQYSYPIDSNTNLIEDAKHHFGFIWESERPNADLQFRRINGALASTVQPATSWNELAIDPTAGNYAAEGVGYPSAFHPGGVNIGFCDGSVRFVSDNIEYRVYAQSMTTKYKRSKFYNDGKSDRELQQPTDADL